MRYIIFLFHDGSLRIVKCNVENVIECITTTNAIVAGVGDSLMEALVNFSKNRVEAF
jgi:hypothetical protein